MPDFRCDAEAHAARSYPNECCGLVVNGEYWPCRNTAELPTSTFVLEPRDYAVAAIMGKVEAVVHSHPRGGPASESDQAVCSQGSVPWHIWRMPQREWLTINP